MSDKPLYLDYAATTPVDPRVIEKMFQYLGKDGSFGNPSSKHHVYGKHAKAAVEAARAQVAEYLHAQPEEIVFTSCATESINTAIKGILRFHHRRGKHIITVKTEHKAVLKVCEALQKDGCDISYLTPRENGLIALDELKQTLRDDTVLVSIMHVNNEFGVVQNIEAIAEVVKARGAFFHIDAVQSAGKLPTDLTKIPADLMSFSGHKLYAPKGVGVLYVRQNPKVRFEPLLHGAGQENTLRAGTLATHQIVAIGEAFALAKHYLPIAGAHYAALRDALLSALSPFQGWQLNGAQETCHPSIVNLSFENYNSQQLVEKLSDLAISTGAACTTEMLEPSPVLTAIGVPVRLAQNAIRLSFGRETGLAEVQRAARSIARLL